MKTTFVLDAFWPLSFHDPSQLPARFFARSRISLSAVRGTSVALAALALAWTIFFGDSRAWSATLTWNSTATGTDWNVASNWGGTVPGSGDTGQFSAASYTSQPSLTGTAAVGGIWDTGAGAVTIGGSSALTLFGTTINSNTATAIEVDAGAGALTINAPLVFQINQQWINNSVNGLTVNGNITAAGSLTKAGSGMLSLTGANAFGVNLTVDGGTLQVPSGSLTMTATNSGFEYIGLNGTGSFTQSGGTNNAGGSLYLGENPGSSGTYSLSGSGLLATAFYLNVGVSGTGSFTQSGGVANVYGLTLGVNAGSWGTYTLSGSGLLTASWNEDVGDYGSASFTQSGGTNNISQLGLTVGGYGGLDTYTLSGSGLLNSPNEFIGNAGNANFTQSGGTNNVGALYLGDYYGSSGTYSLSGSGLLSAVTEQFEGGQFLLQQAGGSNSAAFVSLAAGRYLLSGGTLEINGGLQTAGGTLQGGGSATILAGSSSIVDLTGSIVNTGSTTLTVGANSLVIVPAGFNPATTFNGYSNLGLTHTAGTTLTVAAGQGFGGWGTITDPVNCQGTIVAILGGAINLTNGLVLSGTGNVVLGFGTLTVNDAISGMSGGSLSAGAFTVGSSSTGSFTQTGGINNVPGTNGLFLGENPGSSGTYTLSSSGLLNSSSEYIGNEGTGNFIQSGGANYAGFGLYLGGTGGNGTYTLSGSGLLVTTYDECIGYSGTGSFTQTGGTNNAGNQIPEDALDLGENPGSSGTYSLSGSGVITTASETIGGWSATGNFTQTGGTNSVGTYSLYLGAYGGSGTYALSGSGLLTVASNEYIGYSGTGSFTHSGGTNNLSGFGLYLGQSSASSGAYNLSGSGLLTSSYQYIGYVGTGSFTQSGGTNNAGAFGLGSAGGNGTYSLSGSGLLATSFESIGSSGSGSFTQSGGTNSVGGGLVLAQYAGDLGTYTLNGGLLALSSGGLIQGAGSASFNFGGGTLAATAPWSSAMNLNLTTSGGNATVDTTGGNISLSGNLTGPGTLNKIGPGMLSLSGTGSALGALSVSGGTLQIPAGYLTAGTEYVGYSGNGALTQTGGTNAMTNALYLGESPGVSGVYNLSGGLLAAPSILEGWGPASLNVNGGTLAAGVVAVPIVLTSAKTRLVILAENPFTDFAPIGGPGGLIATGPGIKVFWGSDSYTGDTTIAQGAVELANANAVADSTLIVNVNNGLLFSPNIGTFNLGGLSGGGAVALGDTNQNPVTVTVGGNNASTTFSGSISGSGGLVKSGSGTLTLTGSNSFTGGLVLDPGIVSINGDAALGAATGMAAWNGLTGNIIFVANSTLQADGSFPLSANRTIAIGPGATATFDTQGCTLTIGGAISGAGGLAKLGSGTLVLYGSNTYTGDTTVAAGTLKLDFSQAGAPTANIINNAVDASSLVLGGGTLLVQGNANAANSQWFNGLAVNPGCSAVVLATAGTSNSLLLNLGYISRSPGGTIDFTLPGGTQSATNGIITYTPNTNGILGGYATVSGTDWACSTAGNIVAYSVYTTGDLGALSSNGALNVEPSGPQSTVTSAVSLNSLNLTGSEGVAISGAGSLTLVSGGLIGNTTGVISGGVLEGSASGELIVITPQNLTIASVIADNGGPTALTKAGPARLILTGGNTYSGGTTISAGTLQVGSGGSLGTGPVTDQSALVINLFGTSGFSGGISGAGSLTKTGSARFVLGGSNSYSGGTTISQGVLQLAGSAALFSTTVAINADNGLQFSPGVGTFCLGGLAGGNLLQLADTANAAVALVVGGNGASTTFSGAIGGGGSLIKTGSGSLVLTGAGGYSGGTLVDAGVLQIGSGGTTGSLAGNVTNNAMLVFDRSDSPTFSGAISGSGGLVQAGAGILTLSGSNGLSGGTSISAGAISLNNANALVNSTVNVGTTNGLRFNSNGGAMATFNVGGLAGSGAVSLADGSYALTLSVGGNGTGTTYSGALGGAGGLTKTGSGSLDLCGSSSYTGVTTVAAGQLTLDFSQPGAPTANIVNNLSNSSTLALGGGTLAVQGSANAANSQRFNGLTVNPGGSAIVLTTAGTSSSLLLSLGNITRSVVGGTVDFTLPGGTPSAANGITTTSPNNAAGILGSYATVGGADWACSTGTAGNIAAYSNYTSGDLGSLDSGTAMNVSPSGAQSSLAYPTLFNTLNLTGAYGVTMADAGSLTLAGGGLIGNTFGTISGGTLQGSASGELVVITPKNLTIGSVIADNGGPTALTKAGAATLVLTGSNTYSGATTIAAGTLQVGNGGAAGTLGTGPVIDQSDLVFDFSGVATVDGAVSGAGSLTQAGNGALILSGSNDYTGGTTVTAGTLCATNSDALPNETSLIIDAGGTFVFDPSASAALLADTMSVPDSASLRTAAAAVPVPEPNTLALIVAALSLFGLCRRAATC